MRIAAVRPGPTARVGRRAAPELRLSRPPRARRGPGLVGRPGCAPGQPGLVAADQVAGLAVAQLPAASRRPATRRSPAEHTTTTGRSKPVASGSRWEPAGSSRHSSTLRSTTRAPGSSPSAARWASGRMSTISPPAAADRGQVRRAGAVDVAAGPVDQVVGRPAHEGSWSAVVSNGPTGGTCSTRTSPSRPGPVQLVVGHRRSAGVRRRAR